MNHACNSGFQDLFSCCRYFRVFFGFLDCFTRESPGSERNKWAISIPVAPALQRRPPSRSSLTRGLEAAGLGAWCCGFGQELAPKRIIPFNTGKMGAVLVEEAGGKGLQGSMAQQGRPSVDEGRYHRVLDEAGCLSGLRVCEELDKTGGFFAPSSPCFYAKDDESTSSAAHELGVRALLSALGFGQGSACVLPGLASGLAISGEGRHHGGVDC